MKEMVLGTILPDLQHRSGVTSVIESRVLRTWGQSESGLAELLSPRIAELETAGNPTLAFLASGVEGIKVRITAKAKLLVKSKTFSVRKKRLSVTYWAIWYSQ